MGPVLGPHAHSNRARDTRVAEPRPPAPKDGRSGEGQRLTPDAPRNGGRPTPPGLAPHHPRGTQPLTGHASQRDSAGPPQPHTGAHSTWVADPDNPPRGRAAGGGTAPEFRRPSQRWKAPLLAKPSRHPHSAQRRLARARAVGPVLGPHAHTNRSRETRVAGPRPPTPRDGRPGEGQRLTPDAPHSGGRPACRDGLPPLPRHAAPHRACKPKGQCWAPTPAHPRPQHVGSPHRRPARRTVSRGISSD